MSSGAGSQGAADKVNHWSRKAGLSLRPWPGRAPGGLLLRGVIQVGLAGVLIWYGLGLLRDGDISGMGDQLQALRGLLVMMVIVVAFLGISGAAKLIVGAIDLVPRKQVAGRVVSVHDRKFGDILPEFVQHWLFAKRHSGLDRRQWRHEVVLNTPDGLRQWTVRSSRVRDGLVLDEHVVLSVSPIVGYVAKVEPGRAAG